MKNESGGEMQSRSANDRGFTAIEVLVAGTLLAIVLIGVAGMYISGTRNIGSGGNRSTASFLLHQKLEELRNTPVFPPAPVAPAAPASDAPVTGFTRTWIVSSFTGVTPSRLAKIAVTVSWTDSTGTGGAKTSQAVTYLPEP